MAKSISCKDAGSDCGWSATADTEDALMDITVEHVKEHHKDLEVGPELKANITSLMKDV